MDDRAWAKGMADLQTALATQDQTKAQREHVAGVYRRLLDDLDDETWLATVDVVLLTEDWFPSIRKLREVAEGDRVRAAIASRKREARDKWAKQNIKLLKGGVE